MFCQSLKKFVLTKTNQNRNENFQNLQKYATCCVCDETDHYKFDDEIRVIKQMNQTRYYALMR